jgi:hypothetical protein
VNTNLSNVAVAVIVLLTGLALGMMWGVNRYPSFHGSDLEAFAVTARPVVSVLVVVGCGVAAWARSLREPMGILVGIGVTQLVVSIAYGVLVWLPHSSFLKQPVG